ncbi:hypothetical protein GQ42DRAFT_6813 [Ramicandelaber brevisporus]|nr:hypothetical protein GQ42DRAFT_6813 [Ramicandelaber brevisporus]
MSSKVLFLTDKLINADLLRAFSFMYLGERAPDFASDFVLSPVVAPPALLAQFPPSLMMVGSLDPLIDDTILFAGRIKKAKHLARLRTAGVASVAGGVDGDATAAAVGATGTAATGAAGTAGATAAAASGSRPSPVPKTLSTADLDAAAFAPSQLSTFAARDASPAGASAASAASAAASGSEPDVELVVLDRLSHGFLNMLAFYPDARLYCDYICAYIEDMFAAADTTAPRRSPSALPVVSHNFAGVRQSQYISNITT